MVDSPLVSTDWLAAHLGDSNLRIVDIRGHVAPPTDPLPYYYNHRDDYIKSHIPGAVFIDWVHEITDPASGHHAKIAPPERFAEVMNRHGIGPDTLVVAYDDAQGLFAARLWWSLNYYGHANVMILDGGWNKWLAEGRPLTADVPGVGRATFVARPQPEWIRTAEQVQSLLGAGVLLVDARSAAEYAGQATRAARAGHIPGAINVPRTTLAAPDGTLLSPEQLRGKFAEAGMADPTAEVVTYCNAGVSASFDLLALRIAGFTHVANYDGSWKEWGNDDSKPIE
jgi:thiosulfate/3-mercaptopyruvate sulfurtransferase